MYPIVCIYARILGICCCTFFQFVSVIVGSPNVHVVREESFLGFVTSIVRVVSSGGLAEFSNVSGSGVSFLLCSMSEINLLISSGIIAYLGNLL